MLFELPPINESAALKWRDWCLAERSRHARDERSKCETEFLACAIQFDANEARAFTEYWCPRYIGEIDTESNLPMRIPLIAEVIAPTLGKGRLERRPNYARWSARLHSLLVKANELNGRVTPLIAYNKLWEQALTVDPADNVSRRCWIQHTATCLDYDFHELPMFLSSKQEMLRECKLLERLATELDELHLYADWLQAMRDLIEMDRSDRSWKRYRDARPEWV